MALLSHLAHPFRCHRQPLDLTGAARPVIHGPALKGRRVVIQSDMCALPILLVTYGLYAVYGLDACGVLHLPRSAMCVLQTCPT